MKFRFRYTPLVALGRYDGGRLYLDTLDYENKFSSLGMTNRCHIEVSTESAHRVYLAVELYLDTLHSLCSGGMIVVGYI